MPELIKYLRAYSTLLQARDKVRIAFDDPQWSGLDVIINEVKTTLKSLDPSWTP